MCGFVGVVSSKNIDTAKLNKSDNYLTCRGPDQHKWKREDLNSNLKCILSFHRLSILDYCNKLIEVKDQKIYKRK